jgi:RNA polymerase sigma factor (sigma-70 family)
MEQAVRPKRKRRQPISEEEAKRKTMLFEQLVMPYEKMVYKLTMQYTNKPEDVKDNYYSVLTILYLGIETYNQAMDIRTWIHICTKRHVFKLNRDKERDNNRSYDVDIEDFMDEDGNASIPVYSSEYTPTGTTDEKNWRELYNDDILYVIDRMNPIHREAFLLQEFGYSLKEIAEVQYNNGTLASKNVDTVKSRLFLARQFLRKHLTRDGDRRYTTTN